jgi:uncharacterized membrane protein YtjA (UPF0391 family)
VSAGGRNGRGSVPLVHLEGVASRGAPSGLSDGARAMLGWSIMFAILAVIAGFFGFLALAGLAAVIAKILFVVFLVLLVVSFAIRAFRGQSVL